MSVASAATADPVGPAHAATLDRGLLHRFAREVVARVRWAWQRKVFIRMDALAVARQRKKDAGTHLGGAGDVGGRRTARLAHVGLAALDARVGAGREA